MSKTLTNRLKNTETLGAGLGLPFPPVAVTRATLRTQVVQLDDFKPVDEAAVAAVAAAARAPTGGKAGTRRGPASSGCGEGERGHGHGPAGIAGAHMRVLFSCACSLLRLSHVRALCCVPTLTLVLRRTGAVHCAARSALPFRDRPRRHLHRVRQRHRCAATF